MKHFLKFNFSILVAFLLLGLYSCNQEGFDQQYSADGFFVFKNNNQFGLMNADGSTLLQPKFDFIYSDYDADLIRFEDNSRVGFLNQDGTIQIEAQFRSATTMLNNVAVVRTDTSAFLIDNNGNQKSKEYKQIIFDTNNDLGIIFENGKWGFINQNGEEAIPAIYDQVLNFHNDRAAVRLSENWGYINTKGEEVIPISIPVRSDRQTPISSFKEGFARVKDGGYCYYIDINGKSNPDRFTNCGDYVEGKAQVSQGAVWGFVNKQGEVTFDSTFQWVSMYQEGFAQFKKLNQYGFLNEEGEIQIPAAYTRVTHFQNGIARVQQLEETFYINTKGKRLDFPEGISIDSFDEDGFAIFKDESTNTYGIINIGGKIILPADYAAIGSFQNGLAMIVENGSGITKKALQDPMLELGYVDRNGKIIRQPSK